MENKVIIKNEYELLEPQRLNAMYLSVIEWVLLKNKIKRLDINISLWQIFASALLGVAFACLVAMIVDLANKSGWILNFTLFLFSLLSSLFLFKITDVKRKSLISSRKEVEEFIIMIENRFSSSFKLVVISAKFGQGESYIDCTERLKAAVSNDSIHVLVNRNLAGGDPIPHVTKQLIIEYYYDGIRDKKVVQEEQMLDIG